MNKDNSIVGTRNILTAVWHEIDVCKKALITHYEDYGTDTSLYSKSVKQMHDSRIQDMADALKAQVTLDNIEQQYNLSWKKG